MGSLTLPIAEARGITLIINNIKDFKINNIFRKVCINRLPSFEYESDGISKRPAFYRRDDLYMLAKEAFERGEDEFFYKKVDPDNEYSRIVAGKPEYVYRLDHDLTVEEYESLKDAIERNNNELEKIL